MHKTSMAYLELHQGHKLLIQECKVLILQHHSGKHDTEHDATGDNFQAFAFWNWWHSNSSWRCGATDPKVRGRSWDGGWYSTRAYDVSQQGCQTVMVQTVSACLENFFWPEPVAFRRVYGTWDLLVYHVTIAAPYPGGMDPWLAVYARSCDGHYTTTRRDRLSACLEKCAKSNIWTLMKTSTLCCNTRWIWKKIRMSPFPSWVPSASVCSGISQHVHQSPHKRLWWSWNTWLACKSLRPTCLSQVEWHPFVAIGKLSVSRLKAPNQNSKLWVATPKHCTDQDKQAHGTNFKFVFGTWNWYDFWVFFANSVLVCLTLLHFVRRRCLGSKQDLQGPAIDFVSSVSFQS